jgi:peptidase A4-like protein
VGSTEFVKNRIIVGKRRALAVGVISALAVGAFSVAASGGGAVAAGSPKETTAASTPPCPEEEVPAIASVSVADTCEWAGYVASGGSKPFTYAQATFKVAAVDCGVTPHDSYTSQWVGLDGYHGKTVEQVGVRSECGGDPDPGSPPNAAYYYAWWEMYPKPLRVLELVKPGDVIEASVYMLVGSAHDGLSYALSLFDVTKGKGEVGEVEPCPTVCKNDTAEVISEGFNSKGWDGPADFGTETFSDIEVGQYTDLIGNFETKTWKNTEIFQAQEDSKHELVEDAAPTKLLDGGTTFSVKWLSDK